MLQEHFKVPSVNIGAKVEFVVLQALNVQLINQKEDGAQVNVSIQLQLKVLKNNNLLVFQLVDGLILLILQQPWNKLQLQQITLQLLLMELIMHAVDKQSSKPQILIGNIFPPQIHHKLDQIELLPTHKLLQLSDKTCQI